MKSFIPGQRWFSTAEPELGLGTVLRIAARSVQIVFTGSGVVRQYAFDTAPLARAEFRTGDLVRVDGRDLRVEAIDEADGLMTYTTPEGDIPEGRLDAEQPVSQADSRLLSGRVDRGDRFDFRVECLQRRAETLAHPGHGVLGARIDLIPHQLRVAELAMERRHPRLLLADEVGLGKTIEACLVIARQIATGRAGRVLVLVPESLVHQWFVELKRRFNLAFAIYDEERCESLALADPGANPFEDAQLVIAATSLLGDSERRAKQALEAGWDLLVVDEAHHLQWSPEAVSPAYAVVEALAHRTPGTILLTATPEQLGRGGHFARLRLLDPARYGDLDAFLADSERFVRISRAVDALQAGNALDPDARAELDALLGAEAATLAPQIDSAHADPRAREVLIDALVDRHGTGRVMLRHRRASVGGFPQRRPELQVLPAPDADDTLAGRLRAEFLHDIGKTHAEPEHDYLHDPRFDALVALLDRIAPAKVLVLCANRAKVQALEDALRTRSGVGFARFHEDMNLLQRDRNAAYFAQPDGARVLVASEIGAEGRNFQFAQHLVLWDLPLDPDQLEQRIGRLDRIGQQGDVHIHSLVVDGSPQHAVQRWYDEGLEAFSRVCADGRALALRFARPLVDCALDDSAADERQSQLDALIAQTRAVHAELAEQIASGRDHLLELAARRGAGVGELRHALARDDIDPARDEFILRLLEAIGVHNEPLGHALVSLDPEYLVAEGFEDLSDGVRQATFDRARALGRDDLLYLRMDHPLVSGAMDLLLGGETGNAAVMLDEDLPARSVILEAVFVLECVADRGLHVERFLPPTPLRIAVDTRLAERPGFAPSDRARRRAPERQVDLTHHRKVLGVLVPPMLKAANDRLAEGARALVAEAEARAAAQLDAEIARLSALARVNPAVSGEELALLQAERTRLLDALAGARTRLDALRLVVSPDFLNLRA